MKSELLATTYPQDCRMRIKVVDSCPRFVESSDRSPALISAYNRPAAML